MKIDTNDIRDMVKSKWLMRDWEREVIGRLCDEVDALRERERSAERHSASKWLIEGFVRQAILDLVAEGREKDCRATGEADTPLVRQATHVLVIGGPDSGEVKPREHYEDNALVIIDADNIEFAFRVDGTREPGATQALVLSELCRAYEYVARRRVHRKAILGGGRHYD